MSLSRKDRCSIEIDGIVCFWETFSDIGTQINQGESGIRPSDGTKIQTPGTPENKPLSATKLYDPVADKNFVAMLLDRSPKAVLRSGNTKATVVYYSSEGDANTVEAKYILVGLLLSSFSIPGLNGLSKEFNRLGVEFTYEEIRPT